jgi:transposase
VRQPLYSPEENSVPHLLSITSSVLKTAHWKKQYEGPNFQLPSTAKIVAHADL